MMTGAKILVVEDEEDSRELLVRGLRRLGYEAEGAIDGAAAQERLGEPWQAVVTDLLMPRMDGLSLLSEVRTRCPSAVRMVITSFGDKERVLAALNLGADYLLEKPFTSQQLADVLARLLTEQAGDDRRIDQLFARRLAALPLSERERELVVHVLKGLSNKDIAQALGIGEQTVKNYLFTIYHKLGVGSRGELFHLIFPV